MFKTLVCAAIVSAAFCILTGCTAANTRVVMPTGIPVVEKANVTPTAITHTAVIDEEIATLNQPGLTDAEKVELNDRYRRHHTNDIVKIVDPNEDYECDPDSIETDDGAGAITTHCKAVKKKVAEKP
ncbi:MAG: hypothetical protein AAB467_02050 [Patescibacteria group bacterium]